jgi:hypothetical protein
MAEPQVQAHVVMMVREVTLSRTIKASETGDVLYVDAEENEDDVSDVYFMCDACGFLSDEGMKDHGIREGWEEVG